MTPARGSGALPPYCDRPGTAATGPRPDCQTPRPQRAIAVVAEFDLRCLVQRPRGFVIHQDKPDRRRRPLDMKCQPHRFRHIRGGNADLFQDYRVTSGPSTHQQQAILFRPSGCRNLADALVQPAWVRDGDAMRGEGAPSLFVTTSVSGVVGPSWMIGIPRPLTTGWDAECSRLATYVSSRCDLFAQNDVQQ